MRVVADRARVAVGGAGAASSGAHAALRGAVLVPAFIALARLLATTQGIASGPQIVLWLVLLVIAADIGAYFAGRSFGRRKLAPRVSPGKTWEGALGGLAMVALVAWGGARAFRPGAASSRWRSAAPWAFSPSSAI